MIDKVSVQECALCGACINACLECAIKLEKPYLDFEYPEIDAERCIHCDRCEEACPILGEKSGPEPGFPIAYAGMSREDAVRMRSSSGGVFYELAIQMLRDGGWICGAVFDEDFHVKHIVSNEQEDLLRMMGSKYAQSDMGLCYREIKEKLDQGDKVLFSGCPCQVAGLRTYLGNGHPDLLLVELICHGIPSDRMLQTYIGMQEKKYSARLKKLEFRNKDKGWHNSAVRMEFVNGKHHSESMTLDTYMQGYFKCISLKESCFSCRFRGFASGSDLIIGDFWGAEVEVPDIDDNKGLSVIIVNSRRADDHLVSSSIVCYPVKIDTVARYNQGLFRSFSAGALRAEFYTLVAQKGLEIAIKNYFQERPKHKLKRKMKSALRIIWYAIRGDKRPLY